ncbi:Citrate synthase [Kribbella flavida DSM 17836]|uniref:citrate synthase (unknown stereospecificity) n=1 Tax=Kribbella flavida (strain DSM 17836 / JCM 10339 / NBRC 14399) TaxID=479435 RepID=D2PMZ9_KRIFD|nr:citryl-CoA lyase [Kribbella flavida]ADB32701.1 Citrate synthase [Kribbella flavida DSM 17836]
MNESVGDWWSTGITDIQPGSIRLRGYPIQDLIGSVSYPQMVWLMVRGELPSAAEAELLELTLVAAVDHGPQAPSIAAARMAASCGLDLNNAMATGVNLLGDVHGGAGQQCLEVLHRLRAEVESGESPESAARALVTEYKARKAFIPGFGHRWHPHDPRRDPLITALGRAVEAGTVSGTYLTLALALETVLAEGSKPVPMNVDGATAAIYAELGFAPELARGLFVLSRSVGLLAHAWEQHNEPTRIKGPLPKGINPTYTGPGPRSLPEN